MLRVAFLFIIFMNPIIPRDSFAQLPYYLPAQATENKTYVGVDFFSFGLPVSVVITSDFAKNSIRFGASPTFPDNDFSSIDNVEVDEITFYFSYTRLIGNQNRFLELGGIVLAGSNSSSNTNRIKNPAFGILLSTRFNLSEKLLFRANLTPLFNQTQTKLTVGAGISYRYN